MRPAHGYFKCFGCGESGTAIGFLMKHESMTYPEALRYLAKKYGIEVVEKEETAEELAAKSKRESLLIVMQFACKFYKESLKTDEGSAIGLAYFHSRGLEDSTIEKYGLGWAPKSRHALYDAATAGGYNPEYLFELGLCIRRDDGKVTDKFYDRVMFPIYSYNGSVIGFGGRTLLSDKTVPKYINSNQNLIYDKSKTLYGISFAKNAIHREDMCYLVEGYLDVLSMHQLGITNVVASSGTSLTVDQIRLIKKVSAKGTIMYDGDGAGIKAALRGIGLVLKEGLSVKVVLLPDGDDPDSYSRKHSLEEVRSFIAGNTQDFIEFKTDILLGDAGNDPVRKAGLINEMADTIALIPDAVVRSVYCQTVASKFNIDSQLIFERVRRTREKMVEEEMKAAARTSYKAGPESQEDAAENPADGQNPEPVRTDAMTPVKYEHPLLVESEKELLWFMLKYGLDTMNFETDSIYYQEEPDTVAAFISCNLEEEFHNSLLKRTYDMYLDYFDNHPEKDQDGIVRAMMDGPDREVAEVVAEMVEEKYDQTVKDFRKSMTAISTQLVNFVPLSLMTSRLNLDKWKENSVFELLKKHPSEEETMRLLVEINELGKTKKELSEALGRIR